MTRRVLWICYFFPPAGGAGVQRPVKFMKYLPHFGWDSAVVTVRDGCYFAYDTSLDADVPFNTPIERTRSIEPERLRALRRWHRGRPKQQEYPSSPEVSPRAAAWLAHVRRLFIPDAQIGWLPFAVHAASRLLHTMPVDAIISTSAPYTAHLVALALQRRFNIPWLADFRDAWSADPMGILAHHRLHATLERQVLQHATRVVAVSEPIIDDFRRRVPHASKYQVIPNGFDPDDFDPQPKAPPRPWRITFVGTIYGKVSTVPFLRAVARLRQAQPDISMNILWVGQMDRRAAADYEEALRALGLHTLSERRDYVPHSQVPALLGAAHLLLLPLYAGPEAAQAMSGKIFEYLAVRRPILALADNGVAADLIRRARAGRVAHPHDVDAITTALTTFWQEHVVGGIPYAPDDAVVAQYNRKQLTATLASLLNGMQP